MKKVFQFLFSEQHPTTIFQVGNKVSFKTLMEECIGIVQSIKGDKALVVGFFLSSGFSQWVSLSKLKLIS